MWIFYLCLLLESWKPLFKGLFFVTLIGLVCYFAYERGRQNPSIETSVQIVTNSVVTTNLIKVAK